MNPASTVPAGYLLQTLGTLRLSAGGRELMPRRRKELALLACLAAAPGRPFRREELAELFWGDKRGALARQSLRQALVALRRALPGALAVTDEHVTIAPGAVELDAERLCALYAGGDAGGAAALWCGEFLDGAEDLGTESFRFWLEAERARLRERAARAFGQAVADAAEANDVAARLRFAEQWAAAMPLDDSARAALASAVEGRGRARPGPRPGSAALLTPDLIGRSAALASLADAWSAASAGGGVAAVMEGEPGSGRTRLAAEFARRLRRTGGAAVTIDAGSDGLGKLVELVARAPGASGASPASLGELAALWPPIAEGRSPLPAPRSSPDALTSAARDLIESVAAEQPLCIILDGYPRAAGGAALRQLVLSLIRDPVPSLLTVVTAEPELPGDPALARAIRESPDARRIKLSRLSVSEVAALVESMLPIGESDRDRLAALLHAELGGVPLPVSECVSALADAGHLLLEPAGTWRLAADFAGDGFPLPAGLVAARLGDLSAEARAVVAAAARSGSRVDVRTLAERSGLMLPDVESVLGTLVARRLLRSVEGPGALYELASEAVRGAVLATLPAPPAPVPSRSRALRRPAALLATVGVIALLAAPATRSLRSEGSALRADHVTVLPFENRTGDPRLASTGRLAADRIAQSIGRLERLRVVPAGGAGAGLAVAGSYDLAADTLTFAARIVDVATGGVLTTLRPARGSVSRLAEVIDALEQSALGALAAHADPRIAAAARAGSIPPTWDGYRAFAEGLDFLYAREGDRANAALLGAYGRDTTFVLPLLYAAFSYDGQGRVAAVDSVVRRLEPRRVEMSRYEQAILDFLRHRVAGDLAAQYAAARHAAELAPGSMMAGFYYPRAAIGLNRPREAVAALDRVDPARDEIAAMPGYWSMLSMALHMAGDYERQLAVGADVEARFPRDTRGLSYQVRALAALGRVDSLEAMLGRAFLVPTAPGWDALGLSLHVLAFDELRAHGHGAEAGTLLERAVTFYAGAPDSVRRVPRQRLELARALLRLGRAAEAWTMAGALIDEGVFAGEALVAAYGLAGAAAALEGNDAAAAAADRWLEQASWPYLFGAASEYRARIAALEGRRDDAVRLLRQAVTEGRAYDNNKHLDFELSRLRGYRPFEEWLRPKG